MLKVILYYLLSSISVLGDSIFLYYVSLTLLQTHQGGIFCSIILGLDAFMEILVGPYIAKFIDAIPDLSMRFRRSMLIQVGLMAFSLIPALTALAQANMIFFLVVTIAMMRFFILIDNQLRAALPLSLDRHGGISLVRSLSLATFSQRCIFLVSSTLSPLLLGKSWFFASGINSVSYLFALFALFLILKLTSSPLLKKKEAPDQPFQSPYSEKEKKAWTQWNFLYFFLSNFAFGGVVLILTKSMLLAKDEHFLYQALRGPAPIYGGLLIALVLMMIYHKRSNSLAKTGTRISVMMFILGVGLVVTSALFSTMQIALLFLIGILNGFSLVGSETFLQRKIEGKDFIKALAKAQAFGRVGFLFSLFCVGIGIDLECTTNQLLASAGTIAILASTLLYFSVVPLERKIRTINESIESA